jgi:hypothetical protein
MLPLPPVGRFFEGGAIVDFILGFMALELLVLILVRKKSWLQHQLFEIIVQMGAGAALLLALRAALRGPDWRPIALWLLIALAFHLWELGLRRYTHRMR